MILSCAGYSQVDLSFGPLPVNRTNRAQTGLSRVNGATEPSPARVRVHVPTLVQGPNGASGLTSTVTLVKRWSGFVPSGSTHCNSEICAARSSENPTTQ